MSAPAINRRPTTTHPPTSGVSEVVDGIHPSRNLDVVMNEVLRDGGTYKSHCFLNVAQVRRNLRLFQEHFMPGDERRKIIYAMKANPRSEILQVLAEEGIDGFDCASAGEIKHALNMDGIEPENIYFNNPVKDPEDVQGAYALGVSYFTAQSRDGLETILSSGTLSRPEKLEIAARIETQNPDAEINLSEKYGCSPEESLELLRMAEEAGARPGLAMNTGSQNGNPKSYIRGIKLLSEIARRNRGVSSFNLGGGLPANYAPEDRYDVREYLEGITRAMGETRADVFRKSEDDPRVIIEPGRALIANAVDLLIPVLEIGERRGAGERRVYMGDGIFTSFSDAVIHDWKYHFDFYSRDGRTISDHMEKSILFGRTCDSRDTLGSMPLPSDLRKGDFLWVRNAGAYMDSQRSGFNGFVGGPRYVLYNRAA